MATILLFPTEREAKPVKALRPDLDIRICGVGIIEVALHLSEILANEQPDAIALCGIAGSYTDALCIGDVVAVGCEHHAGLPSAYAAKYEATLRFDSLREVASNTVSQVGADAGAADIENMEGAMLFAMCQRYGIGCGEIRAISNYVGDDRSKWDIDLAIERLADYINCHF